MIPRSVIDNLKCTFCTNGLSIFPIHTYGDKNTVTCGRCPVKQEFLPQREILYEELAQYIEFPCQYLSSGCIEKLTPIELENHEKNCPHKPCLCPVLPLGECNWKGEYSDLFAHYETVHPMLTYNEFALEIDFVNAYEDAYVFRQADETFVAQLKNDLLEQKFYCNVRYCGPKSASEKLSYRACFASKKRTYCGQVLAVQPGEIGPIMTAGTTVAYVNDIMTNLDNAVCIVCKVEIFTEVQSAATVSAENDASREELLNNLECPICLNYMRPPIMQCVTGHSFCESCNERVRTCPTCKLSIDGTRNYALEKITELVDYPCKYHKYGCTYFMKAQHSKEHEANCKNRPQSCIVDGCKWKDLSAKLESHLIDTHKNHFVETNFIAYVIDGVYDEKMYIFLMYGNIFQMEFSRDGDDFYWRLDAINTDSSRYMLELDFSCVTEDRLYIRFNIKDDLLLKWNLLENFITDDMLTYKIRITERE